MNTPHPHRDIIIAWAEGEQIEFKCSGTDRWVPVTVAPSWNAHTEYRIKRPVIMYRLFLWRSSFAPNTPPTICLVTYERQAEEPREKWKGFIRWLSDGWQEVEV